jgi:hypothetical protein
MLSYPGRNRRAVNRLKAVYFDRPEWTPCRIGFLPATWRRHREDLEALVLEHPKVFPNHRKGSVKFDEVADPMYVPGRHRDAWGCVWENNVWGIAGAPVTHPLADWSALAAYRPPDPLKEDLFGPHEDWARVKKRIEAAKARGEVAGGASLPHGFMYMRLYYLRGFDNLMLDLALEEPRLVPLIRMVEDFNTAVIRQNIALGAESLYFGDDLGLQRSLPMSPAMWRRWIKPSYLRMFAHCRKADLVVYQHTDGHVLEIIPDLIEAGVSILNPQIRANGLAGLQEMARGKVCLDQDLDRQLFPFATPGEVEDHVGEVFEGLYRPQGGLMLLAECGPDVPLGNIEAICRAYERLCGLPEADV